MSSGEFGGEPITRRRLAAGFLVAAGSAACRAVEPRRNDAEGDGRRGEAASRLRDLAPEIGTLPPMPPDAHRERADRLRHAMRVESVEAVLLGPTVNLDYFTGVQWSPSERFFGMLLFQSGETHWITPKFEEARALERIGGRGEVHAWEEWEDPHALIASIVERRAHGRTVAVDSHARATHALRLAKCLGEKLVVDALPVTARVRAVKTPPEIARLRRASELTKKALRVVRERFLVAGCEEALAAEAMLAAQQRLGLVNPWCLALFGANAAFPHGTQQKQPLRAGQAALLDVGGELDGYQSDVTRTYCIGGASDRLRAAYRLVRRAQKEALAAARPGVACRRVDEAARRVIVDGGYGPDAHYFTHRLGHGIGREGHEDPYFCRGNETELAPGMTLSNEPGIYVPGEFGVRIEDVIVVEQDGASTLGEEADDEL